MRAQGIPVERLERRGGRAAVPELPRRRPRVPPPRARGRRAARAAGGPDAGRAGRPRHGAKLVRGRAAPDGDRVVGRTATRWRRTRWCGPAAAGCRSSSPSSSSVKTTHQDLFFIDGGEPWTHAPGWVDYDGAVYGTGDLDGLGVKGAPDFEGPPLAPDDDLPPERPGRTSAGSATTSRAASRRSPSAPLKSSTTCRYELSPDSHFIAAQHPEHASVWLLGGGSGHGFKHGPAMAERMAAALRGEEPMPEPSGSASAPRRTRCARRARTFRATSPGYDPSMRATLALVLAITPAVRGARRGADEPDLPVARHPAAGRQRPRLQAGRRPPVSGDPRARHVRRHDGLVEHDRARARGARLLRVGARLRQPRHRRHRPLGRPARRLHREGAERTPARRRCR